MNYSIEGEPLPVVICNLEANETMITEMKKLNKNLEEINETLKVLAVQVHENGGN